MTNLTKIASEVGKRLPFVNLYYYLRGDFDKSLNEPNTWGGIAKATKRTLYFVSSTVLSTLYLANAADTGEFNPLVPIKHITEFLLN